MARFLLRKSIVLKQFSIVKQYCDELSFSAKTNYEVANVMERATDCTFNLHFAAELEKINDTSRVWFFPQGWDEEEARFFLSKKVTKFVVDNEHDLHVLLSVLQNETIDLLLRMKLKERSIHTGRYYVYGMQAARVNRLVQELRGNGRIGRLGIHFHRKSQNISEWNLLYELEQILEKKTLEMIDLLDIGGGIPIQYKNFEAKVHDRIFREITTLRTWLNTYQVKLIIEPGRFIAGPAIKLLTNVRNVDDGTIIVDASVYNAAIDTFVVHHKLVVEGELPSGQGIAYTVKGYTPCSADIFRYRVYLPEVKRGDTLVFLNAGAYNFASDFCSLPKIPTEVIE